MKFLRFRGSFRKWWGTLFWGVLITRILLFRVIYEGPLISDTPRVSGNLGFRA